MSRRLPLLLAAAALAACSDITAPRPGPWAQVAAGNLFTCALTKAGTAYCWGSGVFGQLGNDATSPASRPVAVAGHHLFRSIAVGDSHACALDSAATAWCWGIADYGELGTTTAYCNGNVQFVTCSRVPIAVVGGTRFDSIAVAAYTTCALAQDAQAWCWGWNDHGQLGTGVTVGFATSLPTLVAGGLHFAALSLDVNHACGATAQGALWCWGSNDFGQLAADTLSTPRCGTGAGFYCSATPVAAAAGIVAVSVSAGSTHTCALQPTGEAWCWGSNQYGVLGNPRALGGRTPVLVDGGHAFLSLSAGADHVCALDAAGTPYCWGLDGHGQLGVAAPSACPAFGAAQLCANAPVAVEGAPSMAALSAGAGHTCALDRAGEIWCWGRGTEGQLGNGTMADSPVPVMVAQP